MNVVVETVAGSFAVDLETDEVEPWDDPILLPAPPSLSLPRVVAAAASGSTVVAVVAAKPPLLVSHDAGSTWRESGRGLPAGRAVTVSIDDPDLFVYAARNRLYVSRNGGMFWTALAVELPEIERLAFAGGKD
ncbi:MAG: WD40/YVTN/BNR-like repeat-containing protein [Gaiellaceae bacterium]